LLLLFKLFKLLLLLLILFKLLSLLGNVLLKLLLTLLLIVLKIGCCYIVLNYDSNLLVLADMLVGVLLLLLLGLRLLSFCC